jgi:hypothetical protein
MDNGARKRNVVAGYGGMGVGGSRWVPWVMIEECLVVI